MSVTEKMKIWLQQSIEILSAEAIAKALPDTNQQILFSLQKFMVRIVHAKLPGDIPLTAD
jgi:hypothetical protein